MKIEISPRQSGKTTSLVNWLKGNEKRILITFSAREADRISRDFKVDRKKVLTWQEYHQQHRTIGTKVDEVSIDNCDLILQGLFRERIDKITFSDNN